MTEFSEIEARDPVHLGVLKDRISAERLSPYLSHVGGRIVAELSFGFWRYLLTSRYEKTLWTPAIRHAFPRLKPQRRRTVHDRVQQLHLLRNRIAHREPVWRRDPAADHANILAVAGYICPHARSWIARSSTVGRVVAERP